MMNQVVKLCELALRNNFLMFQEKYYKRKKHGVITGDNNSVTLANISLHYVMIRATKLSNYSLVSQEIIENLKSTFRGYNLSLTSTTMSIKNKII